VSRLFRDEDVNPALVNGKVPEKPIKKE